MPVILVSVVTVSKTPSATVMSFAVVFTTTPSLVEPAASVLHHETPGSATSSSPRAEGSHAAIEHVRIAASVFVRLRRIGWKGEAMVGWRTLIEKRH
jgi:hypothetical protein